jgi:uncharacterized protein
VRQLSRQHRALDLPRQLKMKRLRKPLIEVDKTGERFAQLVPSILLKWRFLWIQCYLNYTEMERPEASMDQYAVERLNKVRRGDRANYDRAAVHAVLDEGLVAHVGFVDNGCPIVVPMIYGRLGDIFYIHGAKAARFAKAMAPGVPVCIAVTLVDGIVVARSAFHMSMNYRSAILHGHANLVTDAREGEEALAAITDHVLPGRWSETRPMLDKELKATSVLRVTIEAASLKFRKGPPIDDEEDYALPIWGGVLPLGVQVGVPKDDGAAQPGAAVPGSIQAFVTRRSME